MKKFWGCFLALDVVKCDDDKNKMSSKKALSLINIFILSLFLISGQVRAASSTNFVLDFGSISGPAGEIESDNFSLQTECVGISGLGESDNFANNLAIYAAAEHEDVCGNGVKECDETCDGSDFGILTCASYGFDSGSLGCSASCGIITTGCSGGNVGVGVNSEEGGEEEEEEIVVQNVVTSLGGGGGAFRKSVQTNLVESEVPDVIEKVAISKPEPVPSPVPIEIIETEPADEIGFLEGMKGWLGFDQVKRMKQMTTDKTPLMRGNLDENEEFEVVVVNEKGKVMENGKVKTDVNGEFVFEVKKQMGRGNHRVQIFEKGGEMKMEMEVKVVSAQMEPIRVMSFGEMEGVEYLPGLILDLGKVEDADGKIRGMAEPGAEIVALFQSEVRMVKTEADKNGEWEVEIPNNLGLGRHSVMITQKVFGVISEDIHFEFELVVPVLGAGEVKREWAKLTWGNGLGGLILVMMGGVGIWGWRRKHHH